MRRIALMALLTVVLVGALAGAASAQNGSIHPRIGTLDRPPQVIK